MKKLLSQLKRNPRARRFAAFAIMCMSVMITALAFAQQPAPGPRPGRRVPRPSLSGLRPPPPGAPSASAAAHPGHDEHAANEKEGGEHDTGGAHGEGEHGAPEPINWTNVWDTKKPAVLALVINFGVLVSVYYMLGKTPIQNALKQRRVTIGKEIDEAQKLLDEAKERAKKYQADLKNADVDAATAKSALVAAGTGEVERLLVEAREKAERMKRDAERLVEQERKAEQQAILIETVEKAGAEATALLQKSVTADDHARLAQDLLLELGRRPAAAVTKSGVSA